MPAAGSWGESGWTYVELARVARDELRELVLDAWRLIAPAQLAAQHSSNPDAASGFVITVAPAARGHQRRPDTKRSTSKQTEGPSKKMARRASKKKRSTRR